MPPSTRTGTRPDTLSATWGSASMVAGTVSRLRPPWLETMMPATPDLTAEDHHQRADPDPGDQREHVRLTHGPLIIVAHAAEIQVKVFVGTHPYAHFTGALLAGRIKTLLRLQRAQIGRASCRERV